MSKKLPSLELLDQLLEVREDGLYNRVRRGNRPQGAFAEAPSPHGYSKVSIQNRRYYAHRIVWYMVHRQDPGAQVIDHIDRNGFNNAPSNLRLVTRSLNQFNIAPQTNNSSGVTGVCWAARQQRWMARGFRHGKWSYLGYFVEKQDAIAARQAWEQEQWAT